jgi:LmbE family N-acetylglucosaminyl deacetylase
VTATLQPFCPDRRRRSAATGLHSWEYSRPPRILAIFAHPDDESFGPAALFAKCARAGAQVYLIVATRGERGNSDVVPAPSPTELGRLREADLRDAARLLGISRLTVLGYEDGTLASVGPDELEAPILQALQRFQPDVVITFGPAGITRHPDHLAIHRAVTSAFRRTIGSADSGRELYYVAVPADRARELRLEGTPDGRPNVRVDATRMLHLKIEALRLHGRHIVDAREMAERLTREPRVEDGLYRVWPPFRGRSLSSRGAHPEGSRKDAHGNGPGFLGVRASE